jgi:hypothetical protein
MSGSASSTATRKCLTKYLGRKFAYTLQEIVVILYTGMQYDLLLFKNSKSVLIPKAEIDVYHHMFSEIYMHAGSFLFDSHRKFLCLEEDATFRSSERNTFCSIVYLLFLCC